MVLFSRESMGVGNDQAIHRFSVGRGAETSSLYGRVIVKHEGPDQGGGKWRCAKDSGRGLACIHVKATKRFLSQGQDSDAEEEGGDNDVGVDVCE